MLIGSVEFVRSIGMVNRVASSYMLTCPQQILHYWMSSYL